MKNIYLSILFMGLALPSTFAQLQDGSIAPDFTTTDLEGNTWNLYDILEEGKSVILDISATWCAPCWDYHQDGALKELHNMYGPNGTDELMVLFVEGDGSTNIDCLYGPTGCNGTTYGDWVTGTPYPITDDAAIAAAYQVNAFPTIYHICPTKRVTDIGQADVATLYAAVGECPVAAGVNNLGVAGFSGIDPVFCGEATATPTLSFLGLGTTAATSATIQLNANSQIVQEIMWTGNLGVYEFEEVTFDEVTVTENTEFEFVITSVNGTVDDVVDDNNLSVSTEVSMTTPDNAFIYTLALDEFSEDIYWEFVDENGTALYTGGNAEVVGGVNSPFIEPYLSGSVHTYQDIVLPGDGCYRYNIYDRDGTGLGGLEMFGFYTIQSTSGSVLIDNEDFWNMSFMSHPFEIVGSATVNNNAAIVNYTGETGDVCFGSATETELTLQNLGSDVITSIKVEVESDGQTIDEKEWTGSINSGGYAFLDMGAFDLVQTPDLSFSIIEVNGVSDMYGYKNVLELPFEQKLGTGESIELELQLPLEFFHEVYWEFVNSAGEVIASGGNEVVRDSGGGAQIAGPSDPGAYQIGNITIEETIPIDATDCYTFRILDDWGDGFYSPAQLNNLPPFSITDSNGNEIYDEVAVDDWFTVFEVPVGMEAPTSVKTIDAIQEVQLFPNPVSDLLNINFNTTERLDVNFSITNVLGNTAKTLNRNSFSVGNHQMEVSTEGLGAGVYFFKMQNANKVITRKFFVAR